MSKSLSPVVVALGPFGPFNLLTLVLNGTETNNFAPTEYTE